MRSLVAYSAFNVFAAAASGQVQAGFWLIDNPGGASSGVVSALSQSGGVAAGWASGGIPGAPGYLWTREGGRNDFGLSPGMPGVTITRGLSSEGGVVAGESSLGVYRWSEAGPLELLGTLPGEIRMNVRGVSGDGGTVIGWGEHTPQQNSFGQAYRWTQSGGMQGLGYTRFNGTISEAYGISRDGSTIVGWSQSGGPGGPVDAFAWTQAGGMRALPQLPGAPFVDSHAYASDADGGVVVGVSPAPASGSSLPVRWTSAGIQSLGLPSGCAYGDAFTVDDVGEVVGGVAYLSVSNTPIAFVWTDARGPEALSDYLADWNVSVPSGYWLEMISAISGDGLTFGGFVRNVSTGATDGFVATVPPPSSLLVLVVPALRRRRRGSNREIPA